MALEVTIHDAQTRILRELLFHPEAGYTELQKPTGLSSDHFNFHIKRLGELGLVEKVGRGRYHLSARGKEYANKLDTDNNTIERQPKVAVLLAVTRISGDGQVQYLCQERLKQPYFGYWGFPSGKMRWGETILQTAARELKEETNLEADHDYLGIYHEHAYQAESGELLEDKLFFVVQCRDVRDKLLEQFEGGRNVWLTAAEIQAQPKKYTSLPTELAMAEGKLTFAEEQHRYSKAEF